jgi:hypothetical protein
MRSEADVVQSCIDVYGDRTDRAEALVARSLQRCRAERHPVLRMLDVGRRNRQISTRSGSPSTP